jgi:hypothetical protein
MRVLLVFLLTLFSANAAMPKSLAAQTMQKAQSNSAQAQVSKTPDNKDISEQSQPVVATESNTTANYYEYQDKDKGESKPDWWLAIFTFALVVVGILQWLVLLKHETWMQKNVEMVTKVANAADANAKAIAAQSGIMQGQIEAIESQNRTMQESVTVARDAAQAARDNASAAKASADALVNSERAWIMVTVEWVQPSGRLVYTSSGDLSNTQTQVLVNLVCVNRGKSPAWIVERSIKAEISDGFYGPDLSTVNDSEIDRQLILLGTFGAPEIRVDRTDLPRRLHAPGAPGNKYILVYGVVKYRDAFTPKGELRETWFGYYTLEGSQKDPLARISQSEYNNYT